MTTFFEYLVAFSAIPFGLAVSAKATVILSTAALAAMALRRRSAAARHLLWTAALIGTLAVPIVSWIATS
jgi:hypothetical protein